MPQGRLIWCSPIIETRHEIPGAWWGRYEYHASFALLLAEHWTVAISSISYEGKSLYQATGPDDASGTLAGYFKFYNGQQTEPDPTMEAELGVGNVPVYRNRSYVVFNLVPLILFRDRTPLDLEFNLIHWRDQRHAESIASNSAL